MPDDYTRLTHDLFRVRLTQTSEVELRGVPDSVFPARLVLTLQARPDLERALLTQDRGAILEVDMTEQVAAKIYETVWQLAKTMGWPLPKLT